MKQNILLSYLNILASYSIPWNKLDEINGVI